MTVKEVIQMTKYYIFWKMTAVKNYTESII